MYVINIILLLLYFTLLFLCAITDYKYGKIYNKHMLRFLIIYICLYIFEFIIILTNQKENINLFYERVADQVIGFIIGFIICFILYLLSVFKAGDAKLLSIVALVSGKKNLLLNFSTIFIVSGFFALAILIKNKIFRERLNRVFLYFKTMILTRKFDKYEPLETDNIKFPLAIYILIGEILVYAYYCINIYKK